MRFLLLPLAAAVLVGCPKKPRDSAPLVGWHQEEGWAGACYHPPPFSALGEGDRRVARQEALEAMKSQWTGTRGEVVSFDEDDVYALETVLLGQPELIEPIAASNLELCRKAMATGGDLGAWRSWLRAAPARLTEGQCETPPMNYQQFDYLDIQRGWQSPVPLCAGDEIEIKGSTIDHYRIVEGGPWITVEGDPEAERSADLPCTREDCLPGMLIFRFTGESGAEEIRPAGARAEFTAPEHGRLEVRINDTTLYDNVYKVESGMQHHASIEYAGQ